MKFRFLLSLAVLGLIFLSSQRPLRAQQAQQGCPAPGVLPAATGENLFPGRKEVDLGDVLAEHSQREWRVIEDPALNAYLNQVAQRLLAAMPGPHPSMQIHLIDQPELNSFALAGGRIYVTRKIVAFARNDAELAGLLSHEMGHILAHQGAVEMSFLLRRILGITEVGDRRDILNKYNRLLDNQQRDPKAFQKLAAREEPDQYQADQIALLAMSNAGYDPQAFPDFFDRLARTKGKTGSWFGDFLGTTTPNQKRLREMQRAFAALAPGCRRGAGTASREFLEWQSTVMAYTGLGRRDALHALVEQKPLNPPLRSDLTRLRFSPDGRLILAQDESSIYLVSREPLRVLFRIEARDAASAFFTPDSTQVVFYTFGHRVERWSIAEEKRVEVKELTIPGECTQSALSPDGATYACFSPFHLSIIEVESGAILYEKEKLFQPESIVDFIESLMYAALSEDLKGFSWAHMGFSGDGRYFVASHGTEVLAFDRLAKKTIDLHSDIRKALGGGFAFLPPDRIFGVAEFRGHDSILASFPECKTIEKLQLGAQRVEAASHGEFILLRPIKNAPLGVLDLKTKKIFISYPKSAAGDMYDDTFLAELVGGEVGLNNAEGKVGARVTLPIGPLPTLHAAEVSPDLRWVAFSGKRRGAVWDLSKNTRQIYTRNFDGGYFDGATFYGDFPKYEDTERTIARASLDSRKIEPSFTLAKEIVATAHGRFLVVRKPAGKEAGKDITLEVHDIRSNALLWSRRCPREAPAYYLNPELDSLVLQWPLDSGAAKEELKQDAAVEARSSRVNEPKKSILLVALQASTGQVLGRLVVDTGKGSFRVRNAMVSDGWIVLRDQTNRTQIYSLASGETLAKIFGSNAAFSRAAGLMAAENEPGLLAFYDLKTFEKRDELSFSYPLSFARFSADGKRLLVITENQTAYLFDAHSLGEPAAAVRH